MRDARPCRARHRSVRPGGTGGAQTHVHVHLHHPSPGVRRRHRGRRVDRRVLRAAGIAGRPAGGDFRAGRLHQAQRGGARRLYGAARAQRPAGCAVSALARRYRDRQFRPLVFPLRKRRRDDRAQGPSDRRDCRDLGSFERGDSPVGRHVWATGFGLRASGDSKDDSAVRSLSPAARRRQAVTFRCTAVLRHPPAGPT